MYSQSRIVARDLTAARRFYAATARALGLTIIEAQSDGFTLGHIADMSSPVLKVKAADAIAVEDDQPETQPAHVAFEAPDDFSVRAFYRAAMEAGGRQLGYPAPQPTGGRYSYYAAKVADPDGNCIECGWRH
ncbi:MAG: VOC family protein [Hyphomonadaceae bacterium]|nr:VOC family protein [Hyphomonadaceae bacterium]